MNTYSPIPTTSATNIALNSQKGVIVNSKPCGELFDLTTISMPAGQGTTLNFLPVVNLIIVVNGIVHVSCETTVFDLQDGQVWLAGQENLCQVHNAQSAQDVVLLSVSIKSAMLSRFFDRYVQAVTQPSKSVQAVDNVVNSLEAPLIFPSCELSRLTVDSFYLFSQLHDDGLNTLKLEELLLLKIKGEQGDKLTKALQRNNNPMQQKFRRFMDDNITNNWSVAMYAKNIGMSLTSFKTMFGQLYHAQSPKAWINEQRLKYADIQLKTTNKKLIDIALDSGFSSQSYFTQLYKNYYGISPSEARN
ncbi:Exoenzyme S synthesis regulatory protein ExsA [Thalassocella blandensis]|nr:Exoenzyme S synthesis regulatory protein ExsA [Thalassocella blandensis]